jgi:glycosyltransferase involved in cell wall biosynthesis
MTIDPKPSTLNPRPATLEINTVSFIVPAKDEERRLGPVLDQLVTFARDQPYKSEIIVVDDGSADDTASVARTAARNGGRHLPPNITLGLVSHERNRGKGAAVRSGMQAASGDVLLYLDADGSTAPAETPKLLALIRDGADVAIGTRIGEGGVDQRASQPAWRRLGGRLFKVARQRLLLSDIADTQCGFKAFRRDAAEKIFARQQLEGWAFDGELLYIARKLGYRIAQAPVQWRHMEGSQFHPSLRTALREVGDILRIRWIHR